MNHVDLIIRTNKQLNINPLKPYFNGSQDLCINIRKQNPPLTALRDCSPRRGRHRQDDGQGGQEDAKHLVSVKGLNESSRNQRGIYRRKDKWRYLHRERMYRVLAIGKL